MRAFILAVIAVIGIAAVAALVSANLDRSASRTYQAHDGSVRLSDR